MFSGLHSKLKSPRFNKAGSVAAAGTTVADATLVTSGLQTVTAADAAKGVILPATAAVDVGSMVVVINSVAAVLKVYPATGGTINGAAANAALSQNASSVGIYFCTAADTWIAIEPALAT
jgi:hypothetical protein